MSDISTSEFVVVGLLWLASLARLNTLRGGPAHRALWIAITGLALSMTARIDAAAVTIDRISGVDGAGVLVKHVAGLLAVAALFDLAVLGATTRIRRHGLPLAGLLAATTTMSILFWAMPRHGSADFTDTAAGQPLPTWYILSWTVYLGAAMALSAVLFQRAFAASRNRTVRAGQLMLTIGCAVGTGYALYRIAYFTARLTAGPPAAGDEFYVGISDDIKYLAILLISAGLCVAAIPATRASLRARRHLRALHPLWETLVPQAHRLDQPAMTPRDRLARHVVELHDAIRALQPRTSTGHADAVRAQLAATGLHSNDLDHAVAATVLHHATGQPHSASPALLLPATADRDAGLAWLLGIARHWPAARTRHTRPRPVLEPAP